MNASSAGQMKNMCVIDRQILMFDDVKWKCLNAGQTKENRTHMKDRRLWKPMMNTHIRARKMQQIVSLTDSFL